MTSPGPMPPGIPGADTGAGEVEPEASADCDSLCGEEGWSNGTKKSAARQLQQLQLAAFTPQRLTRAEYIY